MHQQGYELNNPPVVMPGQTEAFSMFSVNQDNVVLESVKLAEDGSGDLILRLYEAKKAAVEAEITMPYIAGKQVYLCDMLENKMSELKPTESSVCVPFRAFEIQTVRISEK